MEKLKAVRTIIAECHYERTSSTGAKRIAAALRSLGVTGREAWVEIFFQLNYCRMDGTPYAPNLKLPTEIAGYTTAATKESK